MVGNMVDRMKDGRQSGQTNGLIRDRWFIKDGLSCILERKIVFSVEF
jgi:hypothetical protein